MLCGSIIIFGDIMKAIIFDLDGTLWDTSDVVVEKWNEVLCKKCPKLHMTKEIMASLMGKNKVQFVDDFFTGIKKDDANMLIDEIFMLEQQHLKKHGGNVYSGVFDTLKMLKKNYKLIIVSNCQAGYLNAFMSCYDAHNIFDDCECAGNTGLSKGENIKLVLKRNSIDKAIFVGDTKSDELAAKQAGLPFVFASYGFGEVDDYDAIINSFEEIKCVAEQML